MSVQPPLDFDPPPQRPLPPLEAAFREWLSSRDGRLVYSEVRERAIRLRRAGWKHYGIGALWEAVRYDNAVKVGPDADGYRMNDHHRSRLARVLMERIPELAGFFELRRLRSDPGDQ